VVLRPLRCHAQSLSHHKLVVVVVVIHVIDGVIRRCHVADTSVDSTAVSVLITSVDSSVDVSSIIIHM